MKNGYLQRSQYLCSIVRCFILQLSVGEPEDAKKQIFHRERAGKDFFFLCPPEKIFILILFILTNIIDVALST